VLRGSLLGRPVELGSVDPHAVQHDRELPRDSNLGLAEAVSLGELRTPSLERRPSLATALFKRFGGPAG
jgi:hypothetical protein